MNRSLIIRADSTTQIGTGHVMRCLALAQAWQENDGQVVFLSHCESQALQNRIIDEGFHLFPIENPHPHPDDLEKTLGIFSSIRNPKSEIRSWIVLDGYHFTPDYQKAIREKGYRLLVIDDMAHLDHYYPDIVLNQNIHADNLDYKCEPNTRLLVGTKYVLLRREFLKWKGRKRDIPEKAKKLLVTMGGSDPDNLTLKVIEGIKLLSDPTLEVKVIIGPDNSHRNTLKNALLHTPCPMCCVENATNMPELMAWADVGVAAAGSTAWELAFMGLPSVFLVLSENQKPVAEGLDAANVAINIGWGQRGIGLVDAGWPSGEYKSFGI